MIQVTINLEEYKILWYYGEPHYSKTEVLPYIRRTSCEIYVGNINNSPSYVGTSVNHPGDHFSKKEGRKRAFARAVRRIPSRDIRTKLWNTYLNKFGKDSMVYYYKNKPYKIINQTAKVKIGIMLEWTPVVIYEALYKNPDGKIWVREKTEFFNKFKTK